MQLGPDTSGTPDMSGAGVTEAPPAPARCPVTGQALNGVALNPAMRYWRCLGDQSPSRGLATNGVISGVRVISASAAP
jgi:hypothetical protein